jgi:hypothetical protein
MWRIVHVAWNVLLVGVFAILAFYVVETSRDSYSSGYAREIVGDGMALLVLGIGAALCVRRVVDILRCPDSREWERRITVRINMYL